MYSEDSEDDSDSNQSAIKSYDRISSKPYMHLYDKDEAEARARSAWDLMKIRDKSQPESTIQDTPPLHKVYRIMRFFESYRGFHTGSLDLTGRHMPRYVSLHSRWCSYLADFLPLTLHAKEVTVESVDLQGDSRPHTEYVFTDIALWENFRQKWRIPGINRLGYSRLLGFTIHVLRTISEHPVACIQKLCLVDLPAELLDTIFQHTHIREARLLSSTSKKMNEIGRRYIFGSRTLSFDLPTGFWKDIEGMEDPLPYLDKLARSERTKTLETTEFLLSRPDLCQKMKRVHLANNWHPCLFELTNAEGFELSQVEAKFLTPIHRKFMSILTFSTGLVAVSLCSLSFSTRVVRHLSELRSLHTLTVRECLVTSNVGSGSNLDGIELPIYNLRLWMSAKTIAMWHILPLCPELRTLSVLSPLKFNIPMPSAQVWTKCRFFPHLERLCLDHIRSDAIIDLAIVLRAATTTFGLHITHFKLHTRRMAYDVDILDVLDAMRSAPIKVFVFEGLAEAEPVLFSRIAEFFESTLVALTLVRRASDRQMRNREVIWPHPAWKYAPHLSRLTNLQHFGWNSACHFATARTSILHDFELGFPDNPFAYIEEDEDDIETLGLDALPFAAYCPSLETYTSHHTYMAIFISRTGAGTISTKPLNHPTPYIHHKYNINQWNPLTMMGEEWPHIIPSKTDAEMDNN